MSTQNNPQNETRPVYAIKDKEPVFPCEIKSRLSKRWQRFEEDDPSWPRRGTYWRPLATHTPRPVYRLGESVPGDEPVKAVVWPKSDYLWFWDSHPWVNDRSEETIPAWKRLQIGVYRAFDDMGRADLTHWSEDAPTAPDWRPTPRTEGSETKPCPSDVSLVDHLDNEADGAEKAAKPDERALVRLESDLRSIKDDANENGAGNPPDGYGYLDQNSQAIADACFRLGLDSMETALSNWIYDQRNLAPAPSTPEGLKVTQQINEMFATSQPLTTEQETALAEHVGNVMNDAVREERDTANRLKALISEALSPAPFSGESELHDSLKAAYVERILTAIAPFIPASTTEGRT